MCWLCRGRAGRLSADTVEDEDEIDAAPEAAETPSPQDEAGGDTERS
jgi:hypothetical protein